MSNQMNGNSRANYVGTGALRPPETWRNQREPTIYDTQGYNLLDIWLDETTDSPFILVSLRGDSFSKGQLALWLPWATTGTGATTFVGNVGQAVEIGQIVNIRGRSDARNNTGVRTVGGPPGAANDLFIDTTTIGFIASDASVAFPANDRMNIVGGAGISTSAVGNTMTITATTAGSTAGFSAYQSTTLSNVTGGPGGGVFYYVPFNSLFFDQAGAFDTTNGTYTAPLTGVYYFTYQINYNKRAIPAGASAVLSGLYIAGSLGTQRVYQGENINFSPDQLTVPLQGTFFVSMNAGDTARAWVWGDGGSGNNDSVFGIFPSLQPPAPESTRYTTFFNGYYFSA